MYLFKTSRYTQSLMQLFDQHLQGLQVILTSLRYMSLRYVFALCYRATTLIFIKKVN